MPARIGIVVGSLSVSRGLSPPSCCANGAANSPLPVLEANRAATRSALPPRKRRWRRRQLARCPRSSRIRSLRRSARTFLTEEEGAKSKIAAYGLKPRQSAFCSEPGGFAPAQHAFAHHLHLDLRRGLEAPSSEMPSRLKPAPPPHARQARAERVVVVCGCRETRDGLPSCLCCGCRSPAGCSRSPVSPGLLSFSRGLRAPGRWPDGDAHNAQMQQKPNSREHLTQQMELPMATITSTHTRTTGAARWRFP